MPRKQIKLTEDQQRAKYYITAADARAKAEWWMSGLENTNLAYPENIRKSNLDTLVQDEAIASLTDYERVIASRNLIRSMACSFLAIAIEEGIELS